MTHVVITGANRGIGLEFVRQYLAEGKKVIACCRNPEQASELQALNTENLQLLPLDVSDEKVIQALPASLEGKQIALFINNAGVYGQSQSLEDADSAEWLEIFRINTIAPLLLTRTLLPFMDDSQPPKMVYLSSKMGSITENTSGSTYLYRSSKTALNQVVKSLALDLANFGIAVAALHPGWVKTDMGGPNGLIDAQTSVKGLKQVIDHLDLSTSGRFFNYDGAEIPW